MADNYVQDGCTIEHVAGADIASSQPVDLTGCIGVAHGDIASGEAGVLHTRGVFVLPKAAGVAWAAGAALNLAAGEITTGAGTPAGVAWAAAASADPFAEVNINFGVGAS